MLRTGELARLTADVETLARPRPTRARGGQWRRDPAAEWDWFYCLDPGTRSWIARNLMTDYGERPDALAAQVGYDDIEQWAADLVTAIDVARADMRRDPLGDDWADYAAETAEDDLVGPDEVADMLEVTRNALAQWRHRGHLPAADIVLSGLPIWHASTIVEWARRTGREIQPA